MHILAKFQRVRFDFRDLPPFHWLTGDPVGRKVGLALALLLGLAALWFILPRLRWAAARGKALFALHRGCAFTIFHNLR